MKPSIPTGPLGAGDHCAICGAAAGVAADSDGYACLLCGGPRVLVDPPRARGYSEAPILVRAQRLQKNRARWGVAAGLATAFGAFAFVVSGVLALIIHLPAIGAEMAAAFVLGPLLFAAFGFARVKSTSRAVRAALDEALFVVVGELATADGAPVDAAELSAVLHVPIAEAEVLAARAQVEGFLAGGERPMVGRVRVEVEPVVAEGEPVAELDKKHRGRTR